MLPILTREQVGRLTAPQLRDYLAIQDEMKRRIGMRKLFSYYPDAGPLRRELYPKHLEFFRNGLDYKERLFMAANRVGKTEGAGGYETALHLTGRYPAWWEGWRGPGRPIEAIIAGKNSETTRDIVQTKMFGKVKQNDHMRKYLTGDGLVPAEDIGAVRWARGVADLIDTVVVKHYDKDLRFDGWSTVSIKAFERGRGSFEGVERDWIWLDEEPPVDVYEECLVRTMTTKGRVVITFTPLEGMSDVVLAFLPDGDMPGSRDHLVEAMSDEQWGDAA